MSFVFITLFFILFTILSGIFRKKKVFLFFCFFFYRLSFFICSYFVFLCFFFFFSFFFFVVPWAKKKRKKKIHSVNWFFLVCVCVEGTGLFPTYVLTGRPHEAFEFGLAAWVMILASGPGKKKKQNTHTHPHTHKQKWVTWKKKIPFEFFFFFRFFFLKKNAVPPKCGNKLLHFFCHLIIVSQVFVNTTTTRWIKTTNCELLDFRAPVRFFSNL